MRSRLLRLLQLLWPLLLLSDAFPFVAGRPNFDDVVHHSEQNGPRVFLTVSSLAGKDKSKNIYHRQIQLNWYNLDLDDREDYWIGLYNTDPTSNPKTAPLVKISPRDYPSQYYRSAYQLNATIFNLMGIQDSCLGYHIALFKTDVAIVNDCLRINPNWMWRNRHIIGKETLRDLLIPGTHNSGSYAVYNPSKDNIGTRYIHCQEDSVENQLVYGIRYLDMRPSYSLRGNSSENILVSHGFWDTDNTVRDILKQVRRFLEFTKEIVILDFHRFENGFTGVLSERRHKELIDMILGELKELMIPKEYGYNKTLNELWETNKRVMVGYASSEQRLKSNLLFPEVYHLWGDTDTLSGLENYLDNVMCVRRRSNLWSAMAELTASTTGVIFDRYGGLRKMAEDVNLHVTRWVREKWWHCANIVATDFFLGNDLINVAIQSNVRRRV